ncbi:MAG: MBOAT family O-acyltransferase [Thermoleophilia bacterium]
MTFSSYGFLLAFLPVVVVVYWLVPRGRARLVFLFLASCVFYGYWSWRFVPLLLVATLVAWVAGRLLVVSSTRRRRRAILCAAVFVNVSLLAYFKYRGFFLDSIDGALRLARANDSLPVLDVILPIGISFYTFTAISYAVDIYRGAIAPAKSIFHYYAWVTMFPYITAGPIIRYDHVGHQLEAADRQRFSWTLIGTGLFFLILGLAKKVLFADVMAPYVNELFAQPDDLALLTGWGAALGYTLQLYFDFSGYSDMAVGVAFMLGVRFPQNFNSPYKAVNVSEFWRRWHMTLSGWLRDYLYIPLGGSRGRQLLTVRNLFITFLLGGLWHGPAWTFVIWGLLWAAYLSVHSTLRARGWTPGSAWLNRLVTFACAVVAWVFFRAASVGDALGVLRAMLGLNGVVGGRLTLAPVFVALVVGGLVWVNAAPNTWQLKPTSSIRCAVLLGVLLGASILALGKPSAFLYFQF